MPPSLPPAANARVITVAAKRCRLEFADGARVEAITRGKLLAVGQLVVGDLVRAENHRGDWAIEELLPRRNEFVREGLRKERQMLFSNVDRVLILASLSEPQTKTAAIDRFLVAALIGGIPPQLVLTKTDLDSEKIRQNEVRNLYEAFDVPVYPVSNVSGEGVENVAAALGEGITALVGNSGVGKTSLLNRLIPGLFLRVREVSSWSGKGTHTTSAALLVRWSDSAAVVDTPGMKSFVPFGITRESLADLFPDVVKHAADCRFRDCRHLAEPDCAVHAAAERGDLAPSRLRSYHRLLEGLR